MFSDTEISEAFNDGLKKAIYEVILNEFTLRQELQTKFRQLFELRLNKMLRDARDNAKHDMLHEEPGP